MLFKRVFSTQAKPKVQPQKTKLLEGYRVIDASRILVGAYSSMMLADMGAEVIKIEQPGVGDETRKWGPPFRGPDSTYYMSVNRNKKSVTVDLKKSEGKQIIYDLAKTSHIFMTNFTPEQNQKLLIDYETLSSQNPQLIYASVQGFPLNSEWENKAAFDLTIQAMSGLMHCTGDPEGSPFKVGYAVTDILAGMHLLQGIMGAIIHKERTGEGQFLNTSLLEANLYSLCYVVSSWLNGQKEYKRMGNQHPNIAPYTVFKTQDEEYIVIGVATDLQFNKLCELIQMEVKPEYRTNKDRCLQRDQLTKDIQDLLSTNWPKAKLITEMTVRGIPFSEINSIKQLFEKPEIQGMTLTESINSEKYHGPITFSKNPIQSSANDHVDFIEPPLLGENTDEVLRERLGYDSFKIMELKDRGVI